MEIYLDENLSESVADALNSFNKGYFKDVLVFYTRIKFSKDEDVIPAIGKAGGVLITKYISIYKSRMQYQLCAKYNPILLLTTIHL